MKFIGLSFRFILALFLLWGFNIIGFSQAIPLLTLDNVQANPGEPFQVSLTLASAPEGLQQYLFTLSLTDPSIATFASIESVTIASDLFQLVSLSDSLIEFRALDLNNDIRPGSENIVLALVQINGVAEGQTEIILEANAFVDDRGVKIDPQIQNAQINIGGSNQPSPDSGGIQPISNAPKPLPGRSNLPQDLDGDGLFEDVNGDGVFNEDDATLLFNHLNEDSVQADVVFFDFDQDGQLTFEDVNAMIRLIVDTNPVVELPVDQDVPQIRVQSIRANVEGIALVDVILTSAPQGLERYDVRVSLTGPGVAQIIGVRSVALGVDFFEVIEQRDTDIRFRGADLENRIGVGGQDIVLAQLQLQGSMPGLVQVELNFELFSNDDSQAVAPVVTPGEVDFFQGPTTLEGGFGAPNDLDGDGLFEDVNGDGELTEADALLLSFNIDAANVLNNVEFFDFNDDGQITFADAMRLNDLII